jgi:hypothetical protein
VKRSRAPAVAACAVALLATVAVTAEPVRCPVCGEIFENEETPICPNDGTDLRRDGRPVKGRTREADAGPVEEEAVPSPPEPAVAVPKYKRHDVGGERQRTSTEEDGYTDRSRRLGEERRGQAAAAAAAAAQKRERERQREQAAFAEEDRRLRLEFEERREALAERRQGRVDDDPWAGRTAAQRDRRSLWERAAPLTAVGVRLSWLGGDGHPGPLTGAEIDLNPVRSRLRIGLSSFLGVRQLADRGELVFLEHLSAGLQFPWRWSPYLVIRGGIGALATERFGESLHHLLWSVGVEAGLDCHLSGSMVLTPVVGYSRYVMNDAYWDTLTLRLGVGF